MAFRTVSALKDSVAGLLAGLDMANVPDLNATLERGVANMLTRCYVPEASGIQNIALYSGVIDYPINENIYEADIVDIRPQGVSRPVWDFTVKTNQANFDRTKNYYWNGTRATMQYNNGTPIVRIVTQGVTPQVILDQMNDTTGWTAAGTASGLVQDTASYWQSPASLRFSVTTGTGTLIKTINQADLSSYEDVGVAFLAVYIPSTTNLTSISLKLGSSSLAYDSVTATAGFTGAWTANNWLLVPFDFSTSTSTGTPDWSAIDYAQVSIVASGTETNFRVGQLFISMPTPHQILYQSPAIFLALGASTPTTTITANTDEVILNTAPYNIYLYESAYAVLENMSGDLANKMFERISTRLGVDTRTGKVIGGLYEPYMADNPSEQIRQGNSYYDVRNNWWWGNGTAGF
jgi:hypothetical protein